MSKDSLSRKLAAEVRARLIQVAQVGMQPTEFAVGLAFAHRISPDLDKPLAAEPARFAPAFAETIQGETFPVRV